MTIHDNDINNIHEQLKDLVTELFILCQESLAEIDITITQLKVMCLVYGNNNHTVTSIANYLRVSKPTTTRILDRLVQKDLMQRLPDSKDRRVIRCILSEEGIDLLTNVWNEHSEITIQILSDLPSKELIFIENSISSIKEFLHKLHSRKSIQTIESSIENDEEFREPSSSDPWALAN